MIHSSINEGNLLEFENVYVYGSDPFDDYIAAADASYSKLCIQQLNAGTRNKMTMTQMKEDKG